MDWIRALEMERQRQEFLGLLGMNLDPRELGAFHSPFTAEDSLEQAARPSDYRGSVAWGKTYFCIANI